MLVQGGPPNKISNAGWFITRLARVYSTNSFTYIYVYIGGFNHFEKYWSVGMIIPNILWTK